MMKHKKQYNINSEIRNSATSNGAISRSPTSNSRTLIQYDVNSTILSNI